MPSRRLQQLGASVRRRLIAFLESRAPEGYEDESGFHLGPQPKPAVRAPEKKAARPSPRDGMPSPFSAPAADDESRAASAGTGCRAGATTPDLRLAVWNGQQRHFDFRPRT